MPEETEYFTFQRDYLTADCDGCKSEQTFEIVQVVRPYKQGHCGHHGQYRCRCARCGREQVVEGKKKRAPKKRRLY